MNGESHPVAAALWMVGAIVSFTSMAVAGREVSLQLDTFEIMLYRSLIGVVVITVIAATTSGFAQFRTGRLRLHLARNLSHYFGQNLWFYALTVLPFAQVFALEFTSPIWAILLAVVVLGERLTPMRALTAAVGFAGVLVVTRPWAAGLAPGIVPAALAAIGFAGSAVFTRRLARTETVLCILFWLTAMQSVFGLVTAGFDGDIALPDAANWPWIVLIGLAGLVAHYCLTTALSLAPAALVMPVDFARLPVVALVGMAFYGEPLEAAVFAGAALIFGANYVNVVHESRLARAR